MDFPTWLRSRGGRMHPELDFFHTLPSGDRGVIARSDISVGELLLLLPIDCAIYIPTDEEFKKRPEVFPDAVRYLREAHTGLSPFLATTLVLMSEVTRGSVSPWAAYVATLPTSCPDCLLNWTEGEKQELKGTSLEQSGPDPAVDVYRRHVAPILACRTDLWPGLAANELSAAEATDTHPDPGLEAFVRCAGLVQSRAFHLEAENWVSGAKEISHLEGGGTQVFLLPGIDMINHSHNPDRRNAHLEKLNVAQAAAAKLLEAAAAEEDKGGEEDAGKRPKEGGAGGLEAFFVMRADKPIKAGEEVLHTYGNLSDAQLLQTYGFLDSEDDFSAMQSATIVGPSPKKLAKAGGTQTAAAAGDSGGGYSNPCNAALVPWTAVEEVCVGLLKSMDQALPAALRRAKRDFLAVAGVLQSAAPESTQFVLLAQEPLPDELLTAVQVLLMTKDEFQELKREFGGNNPKSTARAPAAGASKKAGGKGAKAGGKAAATSAAPAEEGDTPSASQPPKLILGTALLEEDEDFAEMVCIASLQVLESCMDRYPSSVKDDVRLLRSAECKGRQRLAVRVRLGEKDVLQTAKKAVVELMKRLRDGGAAAESQDDDAGDEESEEEEGGQRRASKRQRRGLGAPPSEGEDADKEAGNGGGAGSGGGNDDDDGEDEAADELLMGSDDSDKVGYGAVEYDDGIGEAHDRGKAHDLAKDED